MRYWSCYLRGSGSALCTLLVRIMLRHGTFIRPSICITALGRKSWLFPLARFSRLGCIVVLFFLPRPCEWLERGREGELLTSPMRNGKQVMWKRREEGKGREKEVIGRERERGGCVFSFLQTPDLEIFMWG